MSQRSIDIECLAGNLVALVRSHRPKGAHVVQAVGHLYEHHADVLAHGEQQLAEILGLQRRLVAEYAPGDFCKPLHELRYLCSEMLPDVVHGVFGVLHHIVQQCRAYACGAETYFLAGDFRHRYGVHDIRLAGAPADAFVCLAGESEGSLDNLHLLAVIAFEVAVEKVGESIVDHACLFGRCHIGSIFHGCYALLPARPNMLSKPIKHKNTAYWPNGKKNLKACRCCRAVARPKQYFTFWVFNLCRCGFIANFARRTPIETETT